MKKLLLGLMLILSVGVFADGGRFKGQEKILESRFEMNKEVLTDGTTKLGDIEYDVNIYEESVLVKLEIETFIGNSNWEKFDKKTFEKLMTEIVTETRNSIGNQTIPVNITLKLDKAIGSDKTLYNKTF